MPPRSPILFWLLLAATLAVDAVATVQMFGTDISPSPRSALLYPALALGQLSVVSIWVVMFRPRIGATWLIPFAIGLAFALIFNVARGDRTARTESLIAYVGLFSLHVAVVLMSLWLLKPMQISAPIANVTEQRPWQFAVRHLLILMTCLALLAFVLSHNDLLVRSILNVVSLVAGNAILLIAVVVSVRPRILWPLRLALSLGAAIGVALVCNVFGIAFAGEMNVFALFLIQAIVIWSWLELYRSPAHDGVVSLSPEATS
jgi:hypothetical protein